MTEVKEPGEGALQAMAIFDAVQHGDVGAYREALTQGAKLVPDPYEQLLMVDCILDARHRAYRVRP